MKSGKIEFYRKKLANGLTVLFEKRELPIVSIAASVNYGSKFESSKIKGISHFVEHMMFKGSKTKNQKEIADKIEKKGGVLNGFTSEEITSYWCKLPSKHLGIGIEIVSDLMLNPAFDEKEFEKEKNVIISEIRMYHDNPLFYVPEKIKSLLYEKPFGISIAGEEGIIQKLRVEDLKKLHKKNYTTDSMLLSVVGNADFGEICKLGEKLYPSTKRKIEKTSPLKINHEEVEKRKGIDQSHFVFGFHTPDIKNLGKYSYLLAGAYLFEGMSSRLFQEVREKRGLAYSIKGGFELGNDYGYCSIYAGTSKDKIAKIREIIIEEIKNLNKLERKDFDECKEQLIGNKKLEQEDSTNAMNSLNFEEIGGGAEEYYKFEDRINNVKLEDVKNISKLKAFSTFSLVPE